MPGRIDVHSHLLPGVDDGCGSVDESLACARVLVANGYTHSFCTPHIMAGFSTARAEIIPKMVADLQQHLDDASIPLKLMPGGEMNFAPAFRNAPADMVISYGLTGKHCLVDMWADKIPSHFEPSVRWLQEMGLQVILAHPERMRAVQDDPSLADYFDELGLLLQGNLQCLGDPSHTWTYRVAEEYILNDRYFMLGSDLHKLETLDHRMRGIDVAIKLVGNDVVDRLMKTNPLVLFT